MVNKILHKIIHLCMKRMKYEIYKKKKNLLTYYYSLYNNIM